MTIIDNDLISIQEARILAENAEEAQRKLADFSQERLDNVVECLADAAAPHLHTLAMMSHEETDYGRWQDKLIKNGFVCTYARQKLRGMRCVGFIRHNSEEGICEVGVPLGVIASICPSTSPVSTTLYNVLIALKSGNAIIFSPHPRAKKVIGTLLDILIESGKQCGLPEGAVSYLHTVAKGGTAELMKHKAVSLILNTGVPGLLPEAYASGKPVIYGGAGNGPVFIERTADIVKAAEDIVESKSFDNGLLPSAEQSLVVDKAVADEVRHNLEEYGAYFMTDSESKKLTSLFFEKDGERVVRKMVGTSAVDLALMAGFSVPRGTRLLIAERKYVTEQDTFLKLRYCPVLAFYVENDWMNACEKCIELLLSERNGHSLVIHSKDENVISQFALKKPVARMLVNTPASLGGIGMTTPLFPSMTLGSGLNGDGITSDNVSPMNLVYIRRVGYGIRGVEMMRQLAQTIDSQPGLRKFKKKHNINDIRLLHKLLKQAIEEI